jgi:hypothetical protein
MLGFEVSTRGTKLALAGLRDAGVLTVILTWVGREAGASSCATAAKGPVPGLDLHVGGLDSSDPDNEAHLTWLDADDLLAMGDEVVIRFVAADSVDAPRRTVPGRRILRADDGSPATECSFCGEMRKLDAPHGARRPLGGGLEGADAFICTRCIVLAERLFDDALPALCHLTRVAGQSCSLCGSAHVEEAAQGRGALICRRCVDGVAK